MIDHARIPAARRPGRRRALAVGLALLTPLLSPLALPATAAHAAPPDTGSTSRSALAFDLPSTSALRNTSRKAFAHWVPSLPVSLDNGNPASDYYRVNYLDPNGEGGKHAAYGGYLRDRPLGRDPIADADWRLRDMETEVRQAISVGLDGFSMTVYLMPGEGDPQQARNIKLMQQAAANVDPGFRIMLQPDMSSGIGTKDAGTLANYMAELARHPSTYRLDDGRVVFSPFLAERHDAGWWGNFLSIMRGTHGIPMAFVPVFLDEQPHAASFAPISYAMSNWGNRNPVGNDPAATYPTSPSGRIAKVRALGVKWMQPISTQDVRPREANFNEAENTTNLRRTWELALNNNADFVQLNTWNDFPEASPMSPTEGHGWSFLDINAYYLTWWKTGQRPAVARDTVIVSHRKQPWQASPSFPQSMLMRLAWGSAPRDTVEALTFLTAPGSVRVQVGGATHSCDVPAGVGVCTVPLSEGAVTATVLRDGRETTSVTSPFRVTARPYVQDLHYVAASSGRTGTRTAAAPPPPAAAPPPPPATIVQPPAPSGDYQVAITPTEDTYANEGAPGTNFGSSASLSSRYGPGAVAFLRLQVPAAPAGRSLVASSLQFRTNDLASAGSRSPHLIRKGFGAWSEGSVNWWNRSGAGDALGTIGSGTQPNSDYAVPVNLDEIRAMQGRTLDVAITGLDDDSLWIWSSNHPDPRFRPKLVLTYR